MSTFYKGLDTSNTGDPIRCVPIMEIEVTPLKFVSKSMDTHRDGAPENQPPMLTMLLPTPMQKAPFLLLHNPPRCLCKVFLQSRFNLLTFLQHSNTTPMTSLSPTAEAFASQAQVLKIPTTFTSCINLSQNPSIVPRIIDLGASDHICISLAQFSSYHHIKPIKIKIPNGTFVTA